MDNKNFTVIGYIGLSVILFAQIINLTGVWFWSSRGIWPEALSASLLFIYLGMIGTCVLIIGSVRDCCKKMEEILQMLKEIKDKR